MPPINRSDIVIETKDQKDANFEKVYTSINNQLKNWSYGQKFKTINIYAIMWDVDYLLLKSLYSYELVYNIAVAYKNCGWYVEIVSDGYKKYDIKFHLNAPETKPNIFTKIHDILYGIQKV